MVKLLLGYITVFAFALYGCGVRQSGKELYLNYSKREVPKCFENFQGMGREVFPDFMSWGVFKYNASYNCIQKEYLEDTVIAAKTYAEDSSVIMQDQKFAILDCKYFEDDLSFYEEALEKNLYRLGTTVQIRYILVVYDTLTYMIYYMIRLQQM